MNPFTLLEGLGFSQQDLAPEHRALGEILVDDYGVAEDAVDDALALQSSSGDRLGDILVARGAATPEEVAQALARQRRLGYVDLRQEPPDRSAVDPALLEVYLRHRVLPWRKVGSLQVIVCADPDAAPDALSDLKLPHGMAIVMLASKRSIDQALLNLLPRESADRAASLTPAHQSVRSLDAMRHQMIAVLGIAAVLALFAPLSVLAVLGVFLFALNVLTTVTRTAALVASLKQQQNITPPDGTVRLASRRPLPTISILIPLYHEAEMLPGIISGLSAVDYPTERLDVKLLLEEDDQATRDAVEATELPPWMTALVMPDGQPRTKPRAMNLALDFCDGDIVGIFDAEDKPDPEQLTAVAQHFGDAPSDVACVQCQLSWFNARETWITRCFQIEYSIWFDVLLRGFQRLGLPIPLGGTSVYFRRKALRDLGGWDAHNVTEDADLGMRLARRGLRTDVLTSTTQEEANTRILPWIRQRSRWLKGYIMTWLCHMRDPVRLWRDLGPVGFFGLNVLFIGGAVTYLAMPIFWIALVLTLSTGTPVFGGALPTWAQTVLTVGFAIGQVAMLACAVLALRRRGALDLVFWVLLLPVYWTLGAAAAWKAVIEVGTAPFYWDKTQHGQSKVVQSADL